MATQKTFVLIKPNAFSKADEILQRIEIHGGLKIIKKQVFLPRREILEQHYHEHVGKKFYDGLMEFMLSGPSVGAIVEGLNAVAVVRKLMGRLGEKGTIRGDYGEGLEGPRNAIHGSDSVDQAKQEIHLWFMQ